MAHSLTNSMQPFRSVKVGFPCEPGTSGRAGKFFSLVSIRSCGRVVILLCDDHACAREILHDDV